jgi:hypothetical protein
MAVEPATNEARTDDFEAHARGYSGFVKLFTYGAIVCLAIGLFVILIIS